jgi:hypothetical protein
MPWFGHVMPDIKQKISSLFILYYLFKALMLRLQIIQYLKFISNAV